MSSSAFNSPATQANSTPLTGSRSTPRKQQPSEDAVQRVNLLKTIDNLETLPTFLSLSSISPLRQLLASFLVAVRARLSCAPSAPSLTVAPLGRRPSGEQRSDKSQRSDTFLY
jgi:hypothetical protein